MSIILGVPSHQETVHPSLQHLQVPHLHVIHEDLIGPDTAKSWRGPRQGVSPSSIGVGKREEETEEEEVHGLEGITFVKRIIRVEGTEGLLFERIQGEEQD